MKTLSKPLLLLAIFGLAASKEYSVTLDTAGKVNVSWSVDSASSTSNITFTAHVECTVTTMYMTVVGNGNYIGNNC